MMDTCFSILQLSNEQDKSDQTGVNESYTDNSHKYI